MTRLSLLQWWSALDNRAVGRRFLPRYWVFYAGIETIPVSGCERPELAVAIVVIRLGGFAPCAECRCCITQRQIHGSDKRAEVREIEFGDQLGCADETVQTGLQLTEFIVFRHQAFCCQQIRVRLADAVYLRVVCRC